jgi:hypothetical protein
MATWVRTKEGTLARVQYVGNSGDSGKGAWYHEKCHDGVNCTGPGCKRRTGRTARRRVGGHATRVR